MKKEKLLNAITDAAAGGIVSEQELLEAFRKKPEDRDVPFYLQLSLTNILYAFGALVVLMGIISMIALLWDDMGTLMRVFITLGISLAMYGEGTLLLQSNSYKQLGKLSMMMSCLLLPLGLFITLDELGMDVDNNGPQFLIASTAAAMWFFSYKTHQLGFFLGFTIAAITWAYIAGTEFLFEGSFPFDDFAFPFDSFEEYRLLSISLSYLLVAHAIRTPKMDPLVHLLNILGAGSFFFTALSLGGYEPNQSFFWEAIFPGLVFAGIYLGIIMQRRSHVVISAIALMVFIIKLTSEYFSDTLGWPLSLVLTGLALIGVGVGIKKLNEKYLSKNI